MKIVHVEDYFDPTAGYQINELLIASKGFNDNVYLITSKDMSPFHKEFDIMKDVEFEKETGVKIIRLESVFKFSSRLILKSLNTKLREIEPDVVYMHGIADFKDLQLWSKRRSFKIIRDCHMSWIASKNRFRHVFYFAFRLLFSRIINSTDKYEVIYALGEEEYEYLKKLGIKDNKIDYLRHGYNSSIMFYDEAGRREVRDKYGFVPKDVVISYIGKFDYAKKPDLIVDIIDLLDDIHITSHNLKLLFVGPKNEEYMEYFNEKTQKIKHKIKIVMDDSKSYDELRKYYSASDICIFPKETTLSSIHAQVCGCLVIMENHKSNRERVINMENLFPENDLIEAANIAIRIVSNMENHDKSKVEYFLKDREYKQQVEKLRDRLLTKTIN